MPHFAHMLKFAIMYKSPTEFQFLYKKCLFIIDNLYGLMVQYAHDNSYTLSSVLTNRQLARKGVRIEQNLYGIHTKKGAKKQAKERGVLRIVL